MIHAYSESYLYDAKQNLAECFDYAISNCRFNADIFSKLFVQSGYADKFERGNPAIVSGISGIELAQEIIMYAYMNYKFPEKIFSEERSEVYWAGWALADDSKIFFQEYLFQKLLQCIAYIMKWI